MPWPSGQGIFFLSRVDAILLPEMRIAPARRTALSGGILLLLALPSCRGTGRTPAGPRFERAPVILISVDTLRSDRLPMYGYRKLEAPALDRLRSEGILFETAYAHIPLTLPSHVSLFTGLEPGRHGVLDNSGYRLDPAIPTLAELLKKAGYATGGAVSAVVLNSQSGIARGFDFWDERVESKHRTSMLDFVRRPGKEAADLLLGWIRRAGPGPVFAFLHIYEPHAPYEPPEPYRSRYSDPYDGAVAYSDAIVGGFLDELRKTGLYDRALIIFLSDHGEGLGDHGEMQHGIFLYRESIQIPLLIKLPGGALAGTSVKTPVQISDVFPTIGEALAVPGFPERPGTTSLIGLASGGPAPERRIFAENYSPRIRLGWSELRSLISIRHQYIEAPTPELYDLAADPAQKENLAARKPPELRSMVAEMERRRTALRSPSAIDSEQAKKLQSLGYLTGSASETGGPLPDPKEVIGSLVELQRAVELHQAGKNAEAIPILLGLLKANPRLIDGWEILSAALESQGRMDEALAALKKTAQLSPPGRTNYLVDVASLALRAGRTEEARKHAEIAWELGDARAAEVLARLRLSENDPAGAKRWAEQCLSRPGAFPAALLVLARIAMLEGKLAEALEKVDEAAKIAGATPPMGLHVLRAEIFGRQDKLDLAEAEHRKELEVFPKNVDAFTGLAIIAASRGDMKEASRRIEAMVRAVPGPFTYLMAVRSLGRFGNASRARVLLGEAKRLYPQDQRLVREEAALRR
jgi:arylsulfatase A-like enzyme/cytochrome c-type biogenesis protein CcmH/NrfG